MKMLTRTDLSKAPLWSHDVLTDAKEFYFIPRIYLMREFEIPGTKGQREVVDIDVSLTPLYIAKNQEVIMKIVDGQLQIRVREIQI
jgi:hypothetical protein